MMRFKTDENVHPDVAALLRAKGYEAVTVPDQGLRGRPDPDLAELCRAEDRALVTLDQGFGDIREYPPEQFAGTIVLRIASQSRADVLSAIGRLVPLLKTEVLAQRLWVVDERSVRIRGGDEDAKARKKPGSEADS